MLTYTQNQGMTILLNEVELHRFTFAKIDHKERLSLPLPLAPGMNRLTFVYDTFTQTDADRRKLAAAFTSLRVE